MNRIATLCLALGVLSPCLAYAFGAIAVDDKRGDRDPAYGFVTGENTREAAERKAMKFCREHGDHCKVAVWFETCGAYATSNRYYGYGYGSTKATATRNALKMCGRDSCAIVVAECE